MSGVMSVTVLRRVSSGERAVTLVMLRIVRRVTCFVYRKSLPTLNSGGAEGFRTTVGRPRFKSVSSRQTSVVRLLLGRIQ